MCRVVLYSFMHIFGKFRYQYNMQSSSYVISPIAMIKEVTDWEFHTVLKHYFINFNSDYLAWKSNIKSHMKLEKWTLSCCIPYLKASFIFLIYSSLLSSALLNTFNLLNNLFIFNLFSFWKSLL